MEEDRLEWDVHLRAHDSPPFPAVDLAAMFFPAAEHCLACWMLIRPWKVGGTPSSRTPGTPGATALLGVLDAHSPMESRWHAKQWHTRRDTQPLELG